MFDFIKRLFSVSEPIRVTVYGIAEEFSITPSKACHLLRLAEGQGLVERITIDRGVTRPVPCVHWVIPPENEDATMRFIKRHIQ